MEDGDIVLSAMEQESGDSGLSPSEVVSSSVGSTGIAGLVAKSAESDGNSAVDIQNLAAGVDNSMEEDISTAAQHGSVEQESSTPPVEFEDGKDQLDDDSQFHDDAGREDMFVDAPDELSIASDGRRSLDIKESILYVEPHEGLESNLVEDEQKVRQYTYELALLQASLEKTTEDKKTMARRHEEEKEMLGRELANLSEQLKSVVNQQYIATDNGNGLVERLRQQEEYTEGETHASNTPLPLMIVDCSKSIEVVKKALDEQLQSEGTIRELHAVLFTKDQEIENLSARVNELLVSREVIVSYMDSLQQTLSQSLQESSQEQVERDLHLEVVTKKLLASITPLVQQEELSDDSSAGRISLLEKGTSVMIENYNRFLSEVDTLRRCLAEFVTEVNLPQETEFDIVFYMARKQLGDHKRMEADFIEKLNQVENESKKLQEQLDKAKANTDVAEEELRKVKMEMEQEKTKCANMKEKLGMAVTRGKTVVQQRDSFKQSLAEKTNELENCLLELQEKSDALVSAEMLNEELVESKRLIASLQESLSKREMALEEIKETLSRTDMPDGFHSINIAECVKWLADQKYELLGVSLEYKKLKSSISSLNLPELVASSNLEFQISWLGQSLSIAEDNIAKLQGELISSKVEVASLESEVSEAFNDIEHLKTSLSSEKQEKVSLQIGLEDLLHKYEEVVEKEFQVTSEKDRIVSMFLEACGVDDQGEFHDPYLDIATFIQNCVGKIKEQITATLSVSSYGRVDQFERLQSCLYVKDQEAVLCKDILEEEMLKILEMTKIENDLKVASEQIVTLKDEKDSLQKDLERAEERSALLREKLSMAVKKGKGVVQEKEGLKKSLEEKNAEIKKLQLELKQQESVVSGCRDQINGLSSDLERISKLEVDLLAMKDQKEQFEKYMLESKSMLARVMESIESVVPPVDIVFDEPVDKVKWLARCFDEYQIGKVNAEQELEKVKEEADSLSVKLDEAHATIRSLENAVSDAEKNNFLLVDEKQGLEKGKIYFEQELERAKEEAGSVHSKFLEACANIKSLEEALARAEENASVFQEEKEAACLGKDSADKVLEKAKEEAEYQESKLAEAYSTIKSLEEQLSQLEKSVFVLQEEKDAACLGKDSIDKELEKAKKEADYQSSKLAEAYSTIKSLEEKLSQLEKSVFVLQEEKDAACLGKDSIDKELEKAKEEADYQASKLAEAYSTIKSLEEGLSQLEKSVSVLSEEKDSTQAGMASMERELDISKHKVSSHARKLEDVFATVKSLEDALLAAEDNITLLKSEKESTELEVQALNAKLSASMAELAGTHGSLESQSVELFSHLNHLKTIMNDDILLASLSQGFKRKFEGLRDLNLLVGDIRDQLVGQGSEQLQINAGTETDPSGKIFSAYIDMFTNGTIDSLETSETEPDGILSYFTKTVEGLNKKNKLLEDKFESFSSSMDELIAILLRSLEETRDSVISILEPVDSLKSDVKNLEAYKKAAESAISTSKDDIMTLVSSWYAAAGDLGFQMDNSLVDLNSNLELENLNNGLHIGRKEATKDATENKLETAQTLYREFQSQVMKLENIKSSTLIAIKELQSRLREAELVSEKALEGRDLNHNQISALEKDLQALQVVCDEMKMKLNDYEAKEDLLKEKDEEISLLQCSLATKEQEVKGLFEKIDQIEVVSVESELDKSKFNFSSPTEKLFAILDSVTQMQRQMRLLSHDEEELQVKIAVQVDEIERLKKEAASLLSFNQDLGKNKSDLTELTKDLESLIQKFGGNEIIENKKLGVKGLVSMLENLVMGSIRECETSKSKAQESGSKLHENEKVVVELSEKVKLLEDSIQSRPALPVPVQERSIFKEPPLTTGSEISEIEDAAPVGRNSVSPLPPAAHVRSMRKGSTDHLALTIDPESDRLINHHETDDDKGHAFKSLNTSGLIPKQGKLMADRIDGIWVSGGRVLMSRPRARLGVIAYCLLLHLFLLGTIL